MIEVLENEGHYREVIERLVIGAKDRLDIATSTIKDLRIVRHGRSESIARFFKRRADNGLSIRVLHSGVPSGYFIKDASDCGLARSINFTMRRCPRVHQKTIIADGRILYLGSANLTGAGLGAKSPRNRNFEFGIVTDKLSIIDRADSLFELIWCGDMCGKCGRKASCPVPLEEMK